jgi:hypothetical protein
MLLASAQDIDCGSFLDKYMLEALDDNVLSIDAVDAALTHLFTVQVWADACHMSGGLVCMCVTLCRGLFVWLSAAVPPGYV